MKNIEEYVLKNYAKLFKNKELIIVEKENAWQISYKDGSPLFLSKNVLKRINMLGGETNNKGLYIEIYSDGSFKKLYK